jgi:hypothetical protein
MQARPVRYGSKKSVVAEEPRPLEAIRCVIMDNLCRIFSISQNCSCNTSDEGTSNEKWGWTTTRDAAQRPDITWSVLPKPSIAGRFVRGL